MERDFSLDINAFLVKVFSWVQWSFVRKNTVLNFKPLLFGLLSYRFIFVDLLNDVAFE